MSSLSGSSFAKSVDDDDDDDDAVVVTDWLEGDSDVVLFDSNSLPQFQDIFAETRDALESDKRFIFDGLAQVADLRFSSLDPSIQLSLVDTIEIQSYVGQEIIISQGSDIEEFYIILGPSDAQVEVVRQVHGVKKLQTRLMIGQYFGQKYFLTNRLMNCSHTIRAITPVIVGKIEATQFHIWHQFRIFLLMKAVPVFCTLPQDEQLEIYSLLQHEDFDDGECIVLQGEIGDKFYVITDGAVDVVETFMTEKNVVTRRTLTRLYEGHFFGELALIYDEPRVASVIAVGYTSCLYITKEEFRNALTGKQFHRAMQQIAYKRTKIRETRMEILQRMPSNPDVTQDFFLPLTLANLADSSPPSSSVRSSVSSSHKASSKGPSESKTDEVHIFESNRDISFVSDTPLQLQENKNIKQSDGLAVKTRNMLEIHLESSDQSDRDYEHDVKTKFPPTPKSRNAVLTRFFGQKYVNNYEILRELGRGNYGVVYLVCDKADPTRLSAMKSIQRPIVKIGSSALDDVTNEIRVMEKLYHPNLVELKEVIDDPDCKSLYLVIEYMSKGPILPDTPKCNPVDEEVAWHYFREVLKGVVYMHSQGIFHRDIKPQNILLNESNEVKLADFGSAIILANASEFPVVGGTPAFMPPEVYSIHMGGDKFQGSIEYEKCDIWGLGATLYTLIFGSPPWMAANQLDLVEKVINFELHFPSEYDFQSSVRKKEFSIAIDPALKHLLKWMLQRDPLERASMSNVINHEWVTKEGIYQLTSSSGLPTLRNPQHIVNAQDFTDLAPNIHNHNSLFVITKHDSNFKDSVMINGSPLKSREKSLQVEIPSSSPLQQRPRSSSKYESLESKKILTPEANNKSLRRTGEFIMLNTGVSVGTDGNLIKEFLMMNPKSSLHESPKYENCPNSGISSPLEIISSIKSLSRKTMPGNKGGGAMVDEKTIKKQLSNKATQLLQCGHSDDESSLKAYDNSISEFSTRVVTSADDNEVDDNVAHNDDESSQSASDDFGDVSELVAVNEENIDLVFKQISSDDVKIKQRYIGGLSPMTSRRVNPLLFYLRAWGWQANLSLGIRYGLCESVNGRDNMEDRISHIPSFQNFMDKKKENNIADTSSFPSFTSSTSKVGRDVNFAFFGVYDGHGGSYVAEYLKNNLHENYARQVEYHGLRGGGAKMCFLRACAIADREIMIRDKNRLKNAQIKKESLLANGEDIDEDSVISITHNFAGSTAVVAIFYRDIGPEECANDVLPVDSLQLTRLSSDPLSGLCDAITPPIAAFARSSSAGLYESSSAPIKKDRRATSFSTANSLLSGNSIIRTASRASLATGTTTASPSARSSTTMQSRETSNSRNSNLLDLTAANLEHLRNLRECNMFKTTRLLVGNIGDSRAVLSDGGKAIPLSTDHKPDTAGETTRIEAAGGWVKNKRVNSMLGVSRAFGDIMYKSTHTLQPLTAEESLSGDVFSIWSEDNQVISNPEVIELEIAPFYEFLILASDGLWNKLTNREAVTFVRGKLIEHRDPQRAASELLSLVENGDQGTDNVSVIIICLNQISKENGTT